MAKIGIAIAISILAIGLMLWQEAKGPRRQNGQEAPQGLWRQKGLLSSGGKRTGRQKDREAKEQESKKNREAKVLEAKVHWPLSVGKN